MLDRKPEPMGVQDFDRLTPPRTHLRGSGGRPFTRDGGVAIIPGRIRRPRAPASLRLAASMTVPSHARIPLVRPNAPEVRSWFRGDDGSWPEARATGLDGSLAPQGLGLQGFGPHLSLAEIDDGVTIPACPRAAAGEPGGAG